MAGFFLLVTSRSEGHSVADASFGWRALVSPPGPSPEIRGGALFFYTGSFCSSLVSGAVADSRGTLPHDGAVDWACELARHVRFHRGRHR